MTSRQGRHKAGSARLQFFVEPHYKALLGLVGQEFGEANMTDTLLALIKMAAQAKGIITEDGKVQPAFACRYRAELAIIKTTK